MRSILLTPDRVAYAKPNRLLMARYLSAANRSSHADGGIEPLAEPPTVLCLRPDSNLVSEPHTDKLRQRNLRNC